MFVDFAIRQAIKRSHVIAFIISSQILRIFFQFKKMSELENAEEIIGNMEREAYSSSLSFRQAFNDLPRVVKILTAMESILVLSQIISGIVALSDLTKSEACYGAHFKSLITFYLIRITLLFPLHIYHLLFHRIPGRSFVLSDDGNTMSGQLRRILEVFGFLWYIIAVSSLLRSSCSQSAPISYGVTVYYIVLWSIGIGLPVIMTISLLFCWPWVLLFTRFRNLTIAIGTDLGYVESIRRRVQGLSDEQLKNIPMRKLKEDLSVNLVKATCQQEGKPVSVKTLKGETCTICLEVYKIGDKIKYLPHCNHIYHADCIDDWLRVSKHCPLCQRNVEESLETTY